MEPNPVHTRDTPRRRLGTDAVQPTWAPDAGTSTYAAGDTGSGEVSPLALDGMLAGPVSFPPGKCRMKAALGPLSLTR